MWGIPYEILPGQKLCFHCKNKVFVQKNENENVNIEHDNEHNVTEIDEISHETANDIVNQSLEILECSSLRVLQSDRTLSIGKRKIKYVTTMLKNVVSITLSEPQLTENSDCSNCQRLVDSVKEKLTDHSNKSKIQMLTLAQEDWTIQKTVDFFSVSEHAVKQAKKLEKEKGILTTPPNYYREGLDKETTKKCIAEFHEKDYVSHMCPGKKRLC